MTRNRSIGAWGALIIAVAALFCALLLGGCGKGAIRDQAARDALEGSRAIVLVARDAGIAPEAMALMDALIPGVESHILASRGKMELSELPQPTVPAAGIAADPQGYAERGEQAKEAARASGLWAWIGGGALVLLGLARQLGLGGPILSVASVLLERYADRQAKAARDRMADVGSVVVREIEMAPPALAQPIKAAVARALPGREFDDVIQAVATLAPNPAPVSA